MPPERRDFSDVPLKKDNPPPPDWLVEGLIVVHDHFGRGRVTRIGLYRRFHTVWVDFDTVGLQALVPQYAVPHMRIASDAER